MLAGDINALRLSVLERPVSRGGPGFTGDEVDFIDALAANLRCAGGTRAADNTPMGIVKSSPPESDSSVWSLDFDMLGGGGPSNLRLSATASCLLCEAPDATDAAGPCVDGLPTDPTPTTMPPTRAGRSLATDDAMELRGPLVPFPVPTALADCAGTGGGDTECRTGTAGSANKGGSERAVERLRDCRPPFPPPPPSKYSASSAEPNEVSDPADSKDSRSIGTSGPGMLDGRMGLELPSSPGSCTELMLTEENTPSVGKESTAARIRT